MYTSYFDFRDEPFSLTPTSHLFYSNPVYEEASEKLLRGIHERVGLMMLTGEVGTGKTTLLRRLIGVLEEDPTVHVISSYYSTLTSTELLNFLSENLGLATEGGRPVSEVRVLSEFLHARSREGKTIALFLDEAQDLEEEVFETLHHLVSIPQGREKALQIVLVGQEPELGEKLALPRLLSLRQDLVVRARLEHLKREEVAAFIQHRLRLVGCEREDLFSPESLRLITLYAQGIPRLINLLCDNALREAYKTSQQCVSETILQKVAHNLHLAKEEGSPPNELRDEEIRWASRETAPTDVAGASPLGRRARLLSALAWGGGGMVVLILLGIAFFTFRIVRAERERSAVPRLRFEDSAQQQRPTSGGQETLLKRFTDLIASALSPSGQDQLDDQSIARGQAVLERLATQRQDIQPLVWGAATANPAVALLLSEQEWTILSKEEQVALTLYMESLIPTVRANPDPYIKEFQDTPLRDTFRAKIVDLCADCWLIGVGPLMQNNEQVLFDSIVVQGDSLWAKSSSFDRGVKASEFRAAQ
jgi:type II secretory pathway predicted ATPase ExeA